MPNFSKCRDQQFIRTYTSLSCRAKKLMIMAHNISATFHLTHHCNLRCSYCYTGDKLPISMSYSTVDQAIAFTLQEAKQHSAENIDITFFGGEPMIECEKIFYIIDAFDRLSAIPVNYRMSTNGTLLTEKLMQKLIHKRVYMSLSVDGHPEVHDRHRVDAGGKGTSAKVARAAAMMLQYNPCTNVTCVISPETAEHVMESVDYIFNLGFRYITTTLDYSANWNTEHFEALKKSYQKLAKWYEQKMLDNTRFYLSFFDERIRTRTYKPLSASERCNLGGKHFSIAPNGELYPCIQFVRTDSLPEFMIGHINQGFDQACRNSIAERSEHPKASCKGCALEERCSKWCSCINFMSTGSVEKASPIVCYNEKILIEIVDRTADRLWKKRNDMFIHKHYNPEYAIISHVEISL